MFWEIAVFSFGMVLLLVVMPLWIVFHHITRWRQARALSAADERALADMWSIANRLETRIQSLERLLDAEQPGWRRSKP